MLLLTMTSVVTDNSNDWEVDKLIIHFNANDGNGLIYWICTGNGIETWIGKVHVQLPACDSANTMPVGHDNNRYGPHGRHLLGDVEYNLVKNWTGTEDQQTQQGLLSVMWLDGAPHVMEVETSADYDSDVTVDLNEEKPKINIRF